MSDFNKQFLEELEALMIKYGVDNIRATYVDPADVKASKDWYDGYAKASNKRDYEKKNPRPYTPQYNAGFDAGSLEDWESSRC